MSGKQSSKLPSFLIVGAMKSATTTLYEQLRQLDGIYLPALKEPNFFSDDKQYRQGLGWYHQLFELAREKDIVGEASTHYTKLPTYPKTLARMVELLPTAKIIYVMRDPVERLVSHYIHEWSCNNFHVDINIAVEKHPELIQYSRYAYQIIPYINHYGTQNVLPVFFENLRQHPQAELARVARFIGYKGDVSWQEAMARQNVSAERLRTNLFTRFLIKSPILTGLRRQLVPRSIRETLKSRMRMKSRPELTDNTKEKLAKIFDADLSILGNMLGVELNSKNYKKVVTRGAMEWSSEVGELVPNYACQ